ncbi:MAG: hypothetical protein RI973_1373 [Bacteroidota bacterium]|jgi:hypothetical protein
MTFRPFCLLFLLPLGLLAQHPVQTLRGVISNAATARPLEGSSVLLTQAGGYQNGTIADTAGQYRFEEVPVGRYSLQVSHVGYETLTLAEVLIQSGKAVVLDVQLQEQGDVLREVVVKAQGKSEAGSAGVHTLTVEEQFRFPATFNDPARLALSLPGVTGNNDGSNVISVRGNSPNALKWRLEGVEIVNPNHSANAGTFADRPTLSGGGVNILSAQLLATSEFINGAFPAGYGNAVGGILDMRFRKGNDQQRGFTAQAGLIGIEAAAEGPLRRPTSTSASSPSWLANYRYSFTGLLSAMGVPLGDEDNRFQDLSFHVSLPSRGAGQWSLFGLGGKSSTSFSGLADSLARTEDKQRFDIDFRSQMGAIGLVHLLPLGKNSLLRTTVALSALRHRRHANPAGEEATPLEQDELREQKLALASVFSFKINSRQQFKAGLQASREFTGFSSEYAFSGGRYSLTGEVEGWLLQPWLEWENRLASWLELRAGLHLNYFTYIPGSAVPESRLSLSLLPDGRHSLSLSYGLSSQTQLAQLYALPTAHPGGLGWMRSWQSMLAYRHRIGTGTVFRTELYYQQLFRVPVTDLVGTSFSALNLIDLSPAYLDEFLQPIQLLLTPEGRGRNYGVDASLEHFLLDRWFFLLAGSLYRSRYAGVDDRWRSTRFDGRYLLNFNGGREFVKNKSGKSLTRGLSARLTWFGGYRDTPVEEGLSAMLGYTVFDERLAFSEQLPDYWRVDLRFYFKASKQGRNSLFSIDLQNVTNRKNAQYNYYDFVLGRTALKRQLGIIPIMSWRLEM